MKNIVFSVMALVLALSACAGTGSRGGRAGAPGTVKSGVLGPELVDGVYEGTALGYRGIIHVRVCIDGGIMSEIEILDSREDQFVGGAAIDELQELALIYNTADLDAIAGATESSEGFLAALSDALARAASP
jgi:uncharacterized protein with FMN-binding domain